MTSITSKAGFDDVATESPDGTVDYAYHGFNYFVAVDERLFQVGAHDDNQVSRPSSVRPMFGLAQRHGHWVEFITSTLGCMGIQFYCGPIGTYRPVEIRTLEFTET